MRTLIITAVDSGREIDRVTLTPDGRLEFATGAARDMFDSLIGLGMSESQAFEMRTGWSNGYVLAALAK